jgi:hypothetical protein
MLVRSPWPRHASLLVHEAKTGYTRQKRTTVLMMAMYKYSRRLTIRWPR